MQTECNIPLWLECPGTLPSPAWGCLLLSSDRPACCHAELPLHPASAQSRVCEVQCTLLCTARADQEAKLLRYAAARTRIRKRTTTLCHMQRATQLDPAHKFSMCDENCGVTNGVPKEGKHLKNPGRSGSKHASQGPRPMHH